MTIPPRGPLAGGTLPTLLVLLLTAACAEPPTDAPDYAFLQERYGFGKHAEDQPSVLSAEEAEADLVELQEILEERFAYLGWLDVDHRAAIQAIRDALGDSIPTGDLALQIHKLLTLFGDGHTQVPSRPDYLPEVYLPVSLGDAREGIVAYRADGSGLVDDEHPLVTAIDGVAMEELLEATGVLVQDGSPQLIRRRSLELVQHPPLWRSELGLPERNRATLTLRSVDGAAEREVEVEVELWDDDSARVWHWLDDERWPHAEYRTLEENLGYLRIRRMAPDSAFVALLHEAMAEFRNTDGLIIDVRGNSGGNRAALMNLFPYLMPAGSPPRITNVARYRLMLQDEACFSATDIFLSGFQGWPGVTLMGTASGGGSGRTLWYYLGNSNIPVRISSMASFLRDGRLMDGTGVVPDVVLQPTYTDFARETDSVLEAAIRRLTADDGTTKHGEETREGGTDG
jgi:hypothetical protein